MDDNFSLKVRSLSTHAEVAKILNAALDGVEPGHVLQRLIKLNGDTLQIGENQFDLAAVNRIRVVGAGKASVPMLQFLVNILGERIENGAIITKHMQPGMKMIQRVEIMEGSHPVPTMKSIVATQRMEASLEGLTDKDLVLCLISGGGSSLMTDPRPGIRLQDLQVLNRLLLACGASIEEFNVLRKHLDKVKGGGLRRLAAPAQLIGLLISDVIGNSLDVIASGPTAPDPTTFLEAWKVVEKYSLVDELPFSIRDTLQKGISGLVEETLKPGDALFKKTYNFVVGDNHQATLAGLEKAKELGFNTLLLTSYLQGEARQAGESFAKRLREIRSHGNPIQAPACIIAGGETTVTVLGKGEGGRNQEFALGAVHELSGLKDVLLATLATDGEDGPTDAAGAVVTGETLERAQLAELSQDEYLRNNDAYTFFNELDDLIRTGSTGTNVSDLAFGFVF